MNDLAELDTHLLPYTAASFQHFFENPATTAITSSPTWYEERTDFSADQLGVPRKAHPEQHGYLALRGHGQVTGTLLGGCLDSLHDLLYPVRYDDEPQVAKSIIFSRKIGLIRFSSSRLQKIKFHLPPIVSTWSIWLITVSCNK